MKLRDLPRCDLALELEPTNAQALCVRTQFMLQLDALRECADMGHKLIGVNTHDSRELLKHIITRLYNSAVEPRFVNIGGGPNFHYLGWRNFDAAEGPLNPRPGEFSPGTTFPVEDGAVELIYSSHCLEHLDDHTVDRVLSEAHRMLQPGGALLLKLPDFDRVLLERMAGNEDFFDAWGMQKVIPTWASRGVEPTIHAKAAMIFCGWWNDAYGGENAEFSKQISMKEGAYHGPAVADTAAYQDILGFHNATPHQLSEVFRVGVQARGEPHYFNHQNAWSYVELCELLAKHKFEVISSEQHEICRRYASVPTLRELFDISLYVVAQKI